MFSEFASKISRTELRDDVGEFSLLAANSAGDIIELASVCKLALLVDKSCPQLLNAMDATTGNKIENDFFISGLS
jgi:hypothetical protein